MTPIPPHENKLEESSVHNQYTALQDSSYLNAETEDENENFLPRIRVKRDTDQDQSGISDEEQPVSEDSGEDSEGLSSLDLIRAESHAAEVPIDIQHPEITIIGTEQNTPMETQQNEELSNQKSDKETVQHEYLQIPAQQTNTETASDTLSKTNQLEPETIVGEPEVPGPEIQPPEHNEPGPEAEQPPAEPEQTYESQPDAAQSSQDSDSQPDQSQSEHETVVGEPEVPGPEIQPPEHNEPGPEAEQPPAEPEQTYESQPDAAQSSQDSDSQPDQSQSEHETSQSEHETVVGEPEVPGPEIQPPEHNEPGPEAEQPPAEPEQTYESQPDAAQSSQDSDSQPDQSQSEHETVVGEPEVPGPEIQPPEHNEPGPEAEQPPAEPEQTYESQPDAAQSSQDSDSQPDQSQSEHETVVGEPEVPGPEIQPPEHNEPGPEAEQPPAEPEQTYESQPDAAQSSQDSESQPDQSQSEHETIMGKPEQPFADNYGSHDSGTSESNVYPDNDHRGSPSDVETNGNNAYYGESWKQSDSNVNPGEPSEHWVREGIIQVEDPSLLNPNDVSSEQELVDSEHLGNTQSWRNSESIQTDERDVVGYDHEYQSADNQYSNTHSADSTSDQTSEVNRINPDESYDTYQPGRSPDNQDQTSHRGDEVSNTAEYGESDRENARTSSQQEEHVNPEAAVMPSSEETISHDKEYSTENSRPDSPEEQQQNEIEGNEKKSTFH
ncbi:unnamed protein product [Echinostoma caproni]|uniref:Melanoma inhibitory activity protein 2 n=1 Tax=Echinostoma caproni TaxID=27848 RepID=A0A183AEV4_9TREM|nr:unnamed protein product [Echinostoma caproni]